MNRTPVSLIPLHVCVNDTVVLLNYVTLFYVILTWKLPKYPIIHRIKSNSSAHDKDLWSLTSALFWNLLSSSTACPPIRVHVPPSSSQTCEMLVLATPLFRICRSSFYMSHFSTSPRIISSTRFPCYLSNANAASAVQLPRMTSSTLGP